MPIDLQLFLMAVGLILAVAVPAIRMGVWLPRRLEFDTIPDRELTPAQADHFARLDSVLSTAAYTPRFNFSVSNMQGPTLTRVYLSDHEHAVLGAHCLRGASVIDEGHVSGQNYLEWFTKYEDGTTLTTRNAELADLFDLMPHQIRQEGVGLSDPLALKRRHDAKASELLGRHPRFPDGRDLLAEFREFHERWCEVQESRGLLVSARRGDRLHASFGLAVPLGIGIPVIAAWSLDVGAPLRPERFPWLWSASPLARTAALAGAYAAGGVAIGYLFTGKSFIWAAVLGYAALRLTGASGTELLLAPWMGFVADWISRARGKRAILV